LNFLTYVAAVASKVCGYLILILTGNFVF